MLESNLTHLFGCKWVKNDTCSQNHQAKEIRVWHRLSVERRNKNALCRCSDTPLAMPKNWLEAFASLITILESSKSDKKVVFLDELSWMNGGDGSFLTALEWFWNSWASARKDILLICCSSATSWIVNKVFHNHGGLYGRVNRRIHLHPFTLQECERLTKTRKSCQLVMITTYGLQSNQYVGMIQKSLTMEDLFR